MNWDWPRRKSRARRPLRYTAFYFYSHHSLPIFPEGLTVIQAEYSNPYSLKSAMESQEVVIGGDAPKDQKDKVLTDDIN